MLNKNSTEQEKIFIGVSWPYANGNIHIGHLAGQYIVCDIFARYHRLRGNKVLMVSGSDSHGTPVITKAEQLGIEPEKLVQEAHKEILQTYSRLGLLYENYTKTTTENHKAVAQNIFNVLQYRGYLNIKNSEQYFDIKADRFLPDRYVKGTCPTCGAKNARGDECPECGAYLEPTDLINPYSTLSDTTPELRSTKHFYLDLRALQAPLAQWVAEASKNWRKWVREFSLGWLRQGLEPRPVTRDLKFGIPVPVKGWEDKVLYVWYEAVIGYISASIEWAAQQNEPSKWEEYWKDPKAKHFYFIAGGNVPFHTILWPAELIAYNEKYDDEKLYEEKKLPGESKREPLNLPFDIPANNMLFYRGKKMSKGDNTGITVEKLLDDYGPDPLRYFFVKYAPEKQDREFIWSDLIESNNCGLVANIGNFTYRALSFCWTRFDGIVPDGKLDKDVAKQINSAFEEVGRLIENREFVKSIERVEELGHYANKYFNDQKPWESIKEEGAKASETIYNSIQLVNALRILIKPYTPFGSNKLLNSLNLEEGYDPNEEIAKSKVVKEFPNLWTFEPIPQGHKINEPQIVFEKFEYTKELEELDNPKKEMCPQARNMQFKKSPKLDSIPTIWKIYSQINARKLKPNQREEIANRVNHFIANLPEDWKNDPKYRGYIELHNKFTHQTDLPGSAELLTEKVESLGQLPKVNGFVDIYNLVSLLTGVSIGAHDIILTKGNPTLTILDADQEFVEIGSGEKGTAFKGEYAYVDQMGIICRLDIKQSQRTRVNEKSCDILVIFQGHEDLPVEKLDEAMELLDELLIEFFVVRE